MAKPEWGVKRLCPNCGARFYDLTNDPATCPACESVFALDALSERKSAGSSQSRSRAKPKPEPAVKAEETEELIDDDAEEIEGDDEVLLDEEDDDSDDQIGEIGDVASDDEEET